MRARYRGEDIYDTMVEFNMAVGTIYHDSIIGVWLEYRVPVTEGREILGTS